MNRKFYDVETLVELLNLQNIVSKIAGNPEEFVNFLSKDPKLIYQLIDYLFVLNHPDLEEDQKIKVPFLISEIINYQIEDILSLFFQNEDGPIKHMIECVSDENASNLTLLGYFSKVMLPIVVTCQDKIIAFIDHNPSFIDYLIRLLQSSCIQDIFVKILQLESMKMPQKHFILNKLVQAINASNQELIFMTFKEIIDDLFQQWIVEECGLYKTLLQYAANCEHPLGVELVGLINKCINDKPSEEHLTTITQITIEFLHKQAIHLDSFDNNCMIDHISRKQKPILGMYKLSIVQTIKALVQTKNPQIIKTIIEVKLLNLIFKLVLQFEWNNSLMLISADIFKESLEIEAFQQYLLGPFNLLQQIIDVGLMKSDFNKQLQQNITRGYQEFFIILIRTIEKLKEEHFLLRAAISRNPNWVGFIEEWFLPLEDIESKWILNVNPNRNSDILQELKEKIYCSLSDIVSVSNIFLKIQKKKYNELSRQRQETEPENVIISMQKIHEETEEDPDEAMRLDLEQQDDDYTPTPQRVSLRAQLGLGDDDEEEEVFVGRNSFGFRPLPGQEEPETQLILSDTLDQKLEEDQLDQFLFNTFWKFSPANTEEEIQKLLEDYD